MCEPENEHSMSPLTCCSHADGEFVYFKGNIIAKISYYILTVAPPGGSFIHFYSVADNRDGDFVT